MRNRLVTILAWTLLGAVAQADAPVELLHENDGSTMAVIPATEFRMGTEEPSPDSPKLPVANAPLRPKEVLLARSAQVWSHPEERPAHAVRLRSYAIDRYEVTNAQYRKFVNAVGRAGDHSLCHPDEPKGKDHTPRYWREFNPLLNDADHARTLPFGPETFRADDKPVVGVDWFDAFAYACWAGKRLPTEAEWELAARGPNRLRWPWGNDWAWGRANTGGEKRGMDVSARGHEKDGYIYAAPVGSFPEGRSPFGCDDMAGNVAEWCADWFDKSYYKNAPKQDPKGPADGSFRAVRGGGSQNMPSSVRCAARDSHEPEFRTFTLGFRCAKDYGED